MIHNAEHYERRPRGSRVHLQGVVASGLGRAHVFMAQPHYQNQFKRVLGAGAWPGTLNIILHGDNLAEYKSLRVLAGLEEGEGAEGAKPLRIRGFERDGRSFGGATAFEAEITRGGDGNRVAIRLSTRVSVWPRQHLPPAAIARTVSQRK